MVEIFFYILIHVLSSSVAFDFTGNKTEPVVRNQIKNAFPTVDLEAAAQMIGSHLRNIANKELGVPQMQVSS